MININDPYYLPDFDEASSSQIPAIIQLINLGYEYIGRHEVDTLREGKSQYILHDIAFKALRNINEDIISDKSIDEAILSLEKVKMDDGVLKASENIFADLLGGHSVTEIIDGKKTSPQLRFIDWKNPENNLFHIVPEFEISEEHDRRPDIVLFVNGIPLAVVENKKASVSVDEAVHQMIRNQGGNQTPKFFLYPQLLVCANVNAVKYGTMLTPFEFYSVWKEKDAGQEYVDAVLESVNKTVEDEIIQKISTDLMRYQYQQAKKEQPTEQDKAIYSLLRPERLLDIVRNFTLYDNNVKKVTRYQQYFAIKKTLAKIQNFDEYGRRRGGVIWHTQGSGKSLTMVMLVKNLIELVQNPRVIVVTDRVDLDNQIRDTFKACNIKTGVKQASSSKDLVKLIKSKTLDVITTLVHKFEQETSFKDDDNNIFILIDEAHRTQGGDANQMMNRILPKACQIAFTGTPLMKKIPKRLIGKVLSKSQTIDKFGGMIDSYTMSEAEADGAVLPLIYQGRFVEQSISSIVDKFYERAGANMSDKEKKDFENKCISKSVLEETSQRIEMIATDVYDHYMKNFKGTGLKAQFVAPSKYTAILFKKALDLLGDIHSEVVISDTHIDDGDIDKLPEYKTAVSSFLSEEKRKYGSLETREKNIIKDFKRNPEGCELLIVVDKLLTGFDAPRDTVLYLAKQLQDHNLLQAVARVNRVYNGDEGKQVKTNGIIIDYSKNAKNLKDALQLFTNYDPEDIERALLDTDEQIKLLERLYQKLHSTFTGIKDASNTDAYIQLLKENEAIKEEFYEDVNKFIRSFSTCYALYDFHQKFDADKLLRYQRDLKRFVEIKKTAQLALAEKVDFSKYKDQLHRLLNKYVTATDVEVLSKEINLSDMREFNQYIEDEKNGLSDKSKAAAIGAQTSKVIRERFKQDEVFYAHFSDRIKALLEELKRAKKEDLASLLQEMKTIQKNVEEYEDNDIPEALRAEKVSHPFYRNIMPLVKDVNMKKEEFSKIIQHIVQIIKKHKIVDFETSLEVKRNIIIDVEDFLLDDVDADISIRQAEEIAQKVWELAVENKKMF